MKTPSDEYTDKEESSKIQPVELYRFWQDGGDEWRYTSGDVAVSYGGGLPYLPATLERSLVKYNAQLEVSTCTITAAHVEDPALRFIAINPVERIWVEIRRLHRDLPLEAEIIFIGQIKTVSFQGAQASVECVGFEHFLQMPIPAFRYQTTCNWKLFSSFVLGGFTLGCKKPKAPLAVPAVVTVDSTGRVLTAVEFGTLPITDGYFVLGTVEFLTEKRSIIAHSGNTITMAYPMRDLVTADLVNAYPGCDGRPTTCRDKFNNVGNSLFFAWIPQENPSLRTP
ncbi:MAG: DUF2163 domain-containing protein [Desulfobacterales bacterium]|nr:DUF2163 domain-containing protein [Desulfobacterales bacterium]